MDLVQYVAIIAFAGVLFWLPSRIEAHWSARDGRKCICRGQLRDQHGIAASPWREYRLEVGSDGDVVAYRRSLLGGRRGGAWRVAGRTSDAPQRRAEFLLQRRHDAPDASTLAVRLPSRSRTVAVLDALGDGT